MILSLIIIGLRCQIKTNEIDEMGYTRKQYSSTQHNINNFLAILPTKVH